MAGLLTLFSASPVLTALGGLLTTIVLLYSTGVFSKKGKYPPGPRPHPIVGHTFQVPQTKIWRYFEKLGHTYGPIVHLSLGGDELVILNDPEDAEELLGRRSQNYSSRKPLIYAGRHQSHDKRLVLLHYGPTLKKQRAAFHAMLQPRIVGSYESMQELESKKFLFDMLTRPEQSNFNTKRYSASLVFTLSYGRRIGDDDKDVQAVLDILDDFIADCYPGAHIVDNFPILDNLPGFLAPWKAAAAKKHENEMKLYQRLIFEVKARMDAGEDKLECFAARLWEQKEAMNIDIESLAYIAGSAFEAGTGTTAGSFLWFLMAMILFPEALKTAHAEMDRVLGTDGARMPCFADINDLPYSIALTKEVFRWMPAAPGGFPHVSDADDVYKGYRIDGGTMVIPNIWAMQHNEKAFPDPLRFYPERFMREGEHEEHDPLTEGHWGFGFGRRICPGRYLGSKSVWIGIARLIWAFDIGPEHDSDGKPIPVDPYHCTSGITSEPEPFPVKITPRSSKHAETIRREWEGVLNETSR